jgi:hypothetical protein
MEELIKQAFMHVDVIGPHVQEGHYDLIGPNGDIILPTVWEKVIQPDWSITMTMWPMDKIPLRPDHHGPPGMPPFGRPGGIRFGGGIPPGVGPSGRRPGGGGGGSGRPPPPPGWRPEGGRMDHMNPDIVTVEPGARRKKAGNGSMLSWMAGGKPSKSGKK